MKIYDETTGAELTSVDEELGCTYQGRHQTGMEPERLEVIPDTACAEFPQGLRQLVLARPIYEDCLYYHPYTTEELVRQYKERLTATDYAIIKIAEEAASRGEYADLIAQRREWRQKINELEGG